MRSLAALTFLLALIPTSIFANELTVFCVFDRSHTTYFNSTGSSEPFFRNQSMGVRNGTTTEETLSADGAVRAANSKTWQRAENSGSNYPVYFGDSGEMLTIATLGSSEYGNFKATLQDSSPDAYAVTFHGECSGQFDLQD